MKSRTTTNLDLIVLIGSILITAAMLQLAMLMREHLAIWTPLEPGANQIPLLLFPLVGLIWFVMQILGGVGRVASEVGTGGIAFWAHVGGFVTGAVASFLFKRPERAQADWWSDASP